eukprot:5183147-Pleurochrysis_carterae.AAC.5
MQNSCVYKTLKGMLRHMRRGQCGLHAVNARTLLSRRPRSQSPVAGEAASRQILPATARTCPRLAEVAKAHSTTRHVSSDMRNKGERAAESQQLVNEVKEVGRKGGSDKGRMRPSGGVWEGMQERARSIELERMEEREERSREGESGMKSQRGETEASEEARVKQKPVSEKGSKSRK